MKNKQITKHSQKGMATLESLPLLVIFIVLANYSLGFFGVVHTAILHSIAARTYAFETFRNRDNVMYFRHDKAAEAKEHYNNIGFRIHGIAEPSSDANARFVASKRHIDFTKTLQLHGNDANSHNKKVHELEKRNRKVSVNPVWMMISYGICINASCGE